ncbi:hypothetical protein JMJ77_0013245, partial [Colletotrichum scovillei]
GLATSLRQSARLTFCSSRIVSQSTEPTGELYAFQRAGHPGRQAKQVHITDRPSVDRQGSAG